MNDALPALQGSTNIEIFAHHLNALHVACNGWMDILFIDAQP